jgi:hypothetical protein
VQHGLHFLNYSQGGDLCQRALPSFPQDFFLMYRTTPMKYWLHTLSTNPYVHHIRPSTSVLSCKHLHIKFHQWFRCHSIRYPGLIRLLQLVGHLYFSGMWLGVHLRMETK